MLGFLQLLAAFLFAIVILGAAAFYIIKRKLSSWMSEVVEKVMNEVNNQCTPFRIRLRRRNSDDVECWHNEELVEDSTSQLLALGFTQIGDFDTDEMPLGMRAFQHHECRSYAVIYDHMAIGHWVDLLRQYKDKTSVTYSTAPDPHTDRPDYTTELFLPELSLEELFEKFQADSSNENLLPAGADTFVKSFEAAYARQMNWQIARGGMSEEEIRRVAQHKDLDLSDEDVQAERDKWTNGISNFLTERMVHNWCKAKGISEDSDEFYRMLGIHNRMPATLLLDAIEEDYYVGAESTEIDEDDNPETIREVKKWQKRLRSIQELLKEEQPASVFRKLLMERGISQSFQCLGTVDKPIKGEIWLRPDDDFDSGYGEGIDEDDFDDLDE